MAYGNYAPFYRCGYFNPMQTTQMPPMAENQGQFLPQYQQPISQPTNDMIWVLGQTEAESYPVAPNNSVVLWDKNNPTIYRFPGGSCNCFIGAEKKSIIEELKNDGYTYYDWNVSSGDATSQAFTVDELVENVMKDVVKYKTSVVLLHDANTKTTTVQALPAMIEALQASGALILPIDENTRVIQHTSIQK